jgi:hypothetical protein
MVIVGFEWVGLIIYSDALQHKRGAAKIRTLSRGRIRSRGMLVRKGCGLGGTGSLFSTLLLLSLHLAGPRKSEYHAAGAVNGRPRATQNPGHELPYRR